VSPPDLVEGFIAGNFDMTWPYTVRVPLLNDIRSQAPEAGAVKHLDGRAISGEFTAHQLIPCKHNLLIFCFQTLCPEITRVTGLAQIAERISVHRWLAPGMNRTHWAVKDVNLPKELHSARGITLPSWARDIGRSVDVSTHAFEVALSFPGEARPPIEQVAAELERRLRVAGGAPGGAKDVSALPAWRPRARRDLSDPRRPAPAPGR
jgi:hypothetical protein